MESEKNLKFGTAGVRAKVNELTPKEAYEIILKVSRNFEKKVCIGRDARNNGLALYLASEAALLYSGKEIYSLGISPTPTVQYYLEKNRMDMGIVITASHNPPEWNGIKIIKKDNIVLSKEEGNPMLEEEVSKFEITSNIIEANANKEHAKAIAKYYKDGLKLMIDYGNGVGKLVFGEALDMLNVERDEINEKVDGSFPGRNSEPTEKNLKDLIEKMENGEYDLGIAFDGDADRVVFVDEKGNFVSGDKAFAILAKYIMRNEGKEGDLVVSTVATSRIVDEAVEKEGGKVIHVKVGTTYIAQGIKDKNALLGGEEAGGIMYPKEHLGKDGMLTAMLMIKTMKEENKKLSELVEELPKYYFKKDKIRIEKDKKKEFMNRFIPHAKEVFKEGKINTIDGIRVDFEDSWFIVRPSGTENYIRFFAEAKSREKLERLEEELKEEIKKFL